MSRRLSPRCVNARDESACRIRRPARDSAELGFRSRARSLLDLLVLPAAIRFDRFFPLSVPFGLRYNLPYGAHPARESCSEITGRVAAQRIAAGSISGADAEGASCPEPLRQKECRIDTPSLERGAVDGGLDRPVPSLSFAASTEGERRFARNVGSLR